jgi:hypothetical protein
MYEYRTTTCHGAMLPHELMPPEPGFRLREFTPIVTSESESYTVGDRYNSWTLPAGGGSFNIPYTQSVQRNKIYQWVILWERYTEQEN